MAPRETENNAYAKFWGDKQRVLWYVNKGLSSYGGEGPQIGEVTCGGSPHLTCKRDQIKMRDYMDRRVTPPKWVTSPTWGRSPTSM